MKILSLLARISLSIFVLSSRTLTISYGACQIRSKKLCKYNTLSSSLKIVQSHQTQAGGCKHCILCQMFFKEILRLLKIFNPRTTLFTTDIIIIIIIHILIEFILWTSCLFRPFLQIISFHSLHLLKVLQGNYALHFLNKEIDTQKLSQPAKMLNKFFSTDDTMLMAESEKLKSLLMKEESEKDGLKLSIQKTKIMASGPIISWQIDGETMETVTDFILWRGGAQNHCRWWLQPWN